MKTIRFTEVRDFYKRNQPDGHWFDADSMRFFKTKLPDVAYETTAGILFVTSEISPSGVKAYTVRRQTVKGDIETIGDFHHYKTGAAARAAIKQINAVGVAA